MRCQWCDCHLDGEIWRIFANDLDGEKKHIADVALCPDGVNWDESCTSSYFEKLKDLANSISKFEFNRKV